MKNARISELIIAVSFLILMHSFSVTATPDGWSEDIRVTFDNGFSYRPVMDADRHNNIHVTWYDKRLGWYDIYYAKLNNNGTKIVNDTLVTFKQSGDASNPFIGVDKKENIHIIWDDNRNGNNEIYYKKLNNSGVNLTGDIRLTNNPTNSWDSFFIIDRKNDIHVIWADEIDGNREIYYMKLDNNGNKIINTTRLTFDTAQSMYPALAADRENNFHLTWNDDRDGNWEVYYKKFDSLANILVNDTRLTFDPNYSFLPVRQNPITTDSLKNVHIVWSDDRDGNQEVYYTKLDNQGNTIVDDLRLTYNNSMSTSPSIARDSFDNLHISWTDGRDGNDEIYYTKLKNNGTKIIDDLRLTNNTAGSEDSYIVVDYINGIHVGWMDLRDGNWEIYYKNRFCGTYLHHHNIRLCKI